MRAVSTSTVSGTLSSMSKAFSGDASHFQLLFTWLLGGILFLFLFLMFTSFCFALFRRGNEEGSPARRYDQSSANGTEGRNRESGRIAAGSTGRGRLDCVIFQAPAQVPRETPVAILHGDGVGLFPGVFPSPFLGAPLLEWALCLFAGWHKGGMGCLCMGGLLHFKLKWTEKGRLKTWFLPPCV